MEKKDFDALLQSDAENADKDVSLKDLQTKASEMVNLASEIAEMEAEIEEKKKQYITHKYRQVGISLCLYFGRYWLF